MKKHYQTDEIVILHRYISILLTQYNIYSKYLLKYQYVVIHLKRPNA